MQEFRMELILKSHRYELLQFRRQRQKIRDTFGMNICNNCGKQYKHTHNICSGRLKFNSRILQKYHKIDIKIRQDNRKFIDTCAQNNICLDICREIQSFDDIYRTQYNDVMCEIVKRKWNWGMDFVFPTSVDLIGGLIRPIRNTLYRECI